MYLRLGQTLPFVLVVEMAQMTAKKHEGKEIPSTKPERASKQHGDIKVIGSRKKPRISPLQNPVISNRTKIRQGVQKIQVQLYIYQADAGTLGMGE